MNKAVLLAFCLLLALGCNAQINESDTTKLQLQLLSGGSYQTGNVELLRVINQLDFSFNVSSHVVFKTQNDHLYQEILSKKADSDLVSKNYLYYKPHRKLYPYVISFIASNYRRDLDVRIFGGLGVTYQLLQKPQDVIKLSSNLLYEKSRYTRNDFNYSEFNGSKEIEAFWSTVYLNGFHSLNESTIRWIYEIYYQQSLQDQINYRIHASTGIDIKVVKGLSIQSRIIYSQENVIVVSNQQKDLLWIWGLTYKIKK